MKYTTDDLVTYVRMNARIPSGSEALTDQEILDIAYDELLGFVVPAVRRVKEEFYVKHHDITIVSGTSEYRLPKRASGAGARDVVFLDSDGNESSAPYIPLEDVPKHAAGLTSRWPAGHSFRGDHLVIVPTPNSTSFPTVRVKYFCRPNRLVPQANGFPVSSMSDGGATVTINTDASGTVPSWDADNAYVDVIQGTPNFDWTIMEADVTAITPGAGGSVTVTLADTVDETYADYCHLAFAPEDGTVVPESSIIQCPVELHPSLRALTTARVLAILGYLDQAGPWQELAERRLSEGIITMDPRNEGDIQQVVNWESPLRHGYLRK